MSDVRFLVKRYLEEGFGRPHPIPRGEKGPRIEGWNDPQRRFGVEDFAEDDNVGTALTGDLVDVDLDTPEAIAAAKDFLPPTQRIHGNEAKPDSHWWYRCADVKSRVFKDVPRPDPHEPGKLKTATLVEIRAGHRHQTMLPPSRHPRGYDVFWSIDKEPGQPDAAELLRGVVLDATVALMARSWPKGNRHFAAAHLAGFLAARRVPDKTVVLVVRRTAEIARDDEVDDRVRAATDTVAAFKGGEKTTGGPALEELVGKEVVGRLLEWYGGNSSIHDGLVEELNTRRFGVRVGKDYVYGLETPERVVFQPARALFEEFSNQKIKVGDKKMGADKGAPVFKTKFEIWREHPNKRTYRTVVFAPPPIQADARDYNLWTGFAVTPLTPPEGHEARSSALALREWADRELRPQIDRYLDLMQQVICAGNQEYYHYLLKWMALAVQEPGVPGEVAVVMKGELGVGKGTFAREFGRLFGRHYTHLDRTEQLAGKFNAAISAKVLVFADEAFFAGDKKDLGSLKRLITEPTLAIERKGIDVIEEANCVHLIMATNSDHAHQAAMKERRFFTVHVSDVHLQDHAYFNGVIEQIRSHPSALLSYLLTREVTHDDIRRVPMTEELRVQQEKSLPFELQWWADKLYTGSIGEGEEAGWPEEISTRVLYQDYLQMCEERKINRRISEVEMGRSTLKPWLGEQRRPREDDGTRRSKRALLPLAQARQKFDEIAGTKMGWPDDENSQPPGAGRGEVKDLPF